MNTQQQTYSDLSRKKSAAKTGTMTASWGLMTGIIVIAANLRAPLTSVGPLVGSIRDHLHLSNTQAGAITTLPLLAFALSSPFAPKLAKRFKIETILLVSVILLTAGILCRSLSGTAALFVGTSLLGLAISVCNVLVPGLIKREFPERVGMMTGIYSVSMNLCGAIASGISVPIATGLGWGWQGALGVWCVLSFAAVLGWLPQIAKRREANGAAPRQASSDQVHLWRSPLAWRVTLFMGLQSLFFYVTVAWLPEILSQRGIGTDHSGWLLSIMQLSLLPFTFVVPIFAGRMSSQRSLAAMTSLLFLTGTLGLLYGSTKLIVLWIMLVGIGAGFAFSLAMMFFSLRTRTSQQAAELSGMAQSVGYLLAALGPALFGYLHDATASWTVPLLILVAAAIVMFVAGWGAASDRYVDSKS